ncbi:MAG: hypothetical protein HQL94_05420 [Magnetococcales bacterium]|nr:hypothetical protein [Magnetococcales bacterium]
MAPGDPPLEITCPTLARLAAVGETGSIQPLMGVGGVLQQMLAPNHPDILNFSGYLSAVGSGLNPDPERTWACLDFAHLKQLRDRLIFILPDRVALSPAERALLTDGLMEVLEDAGWTLHATPNNRPQLISTSHPLEVTVTPLDHLDDTSFVDHQPKGANALAILALITHGQMALARHIVNRKRLDAKIPPLNTPWIWGIGRGVDWQASRMVTKGMNWSTNAARAGLASTAGFSANVLSPSEDNANEFEQWLSKVRNADPIPGLMMLDAPRTAERLPWLASLDKNLLAPLAAELATHPGRLLIIGDKPCSWIFAQGRGLTAKKWFWMRHSMGMGQPMDPLALKEKWLTLDSGGLT